MQTVSSVADAVMPSVAVLSSRVIRIMGLNPGPFTLQGSNTYLIGTGTERVLIDSGEGVPAYGDLLLKAVGDESSRLGSPVLVSTLLLTHWHEDHIGGVDTVRKLFPQVRLLKRPSQYTSTRFDALCALPPAEIAVEGATLQLLHTPGHTDDHFCAFLKEEKALFTGDMILGAGSSVFSSFTEYMQSLKLLKSLQPSKLYSAHGPVAEDGTARIEETIRHRNLREHQVLQVLRDRALGAAPNAPHTTKHNRTESNEIVGELNIRDIVEVIYKTIPPELKDAAGANVFHHLKKLISEGDVVVRHVPADITAYLQETTDYTTFGEGASFDVNLLRRILTEFYVAAAAEVRGPTP
ncbi:metallo-beta-lactamase family-like protein [Leptomonas pyrrhocoris]|uniref:Metallo-beta-lactamase family-like protein n=1 Tax=Leptomonas pyrrhocoris TaxID=157538 RepID=A0A0M9FXN1_LEPPY|nr:metallo-beta-lactamase family-like protein [Leptomonas pyrrhocoris]KPA78195.1 metallo-beta-lactamase family-like protein [Leptomonas pyrrhocoris]|eukprot:XP_015656634.1 metallo-beta-lactamase family-like protein [Leptomonas pyrrhocoris]